MASAGTLGAGVDLDGSLSFASRERAHVCFISLHDGAVSMIDLDGRNIRNMLAAGATAADERILAQPSRDGERLDLWAIRNGHERRLILEGFASRDSRPFLDRADEATQERDTTYLGRDRRSAWLVTTYAFAGHGLVAERRDGTERFSVAVETPFLAWVACSATVLPSDLVVFELGEQIVLLDPTQRKLGVLARGRSPLVLLDG